MRTAMPEVDEIEEKGNKKTGNGGRCERGRGNRSWGVIGHPMTSVFLKILLFKICGAVYTSKTVKTKFCGLSLLWYPLELLKFF
jgi:hypothetical protein